MDIDNLPARRGEKKLDSKKLSALERLKKIRAGEKVEEEEEIEEDEYEYIEEEEEYEDEYVSKKSSKKHQNQKKENLNGDKTKKHKAKLTRDKTSNIEEAEEATNKGLDIRKAFFKAATQVKSDKYKTEVQTVDNDDDDLAMEIMKELNQAKKSVPEKKLSQRPKPSPASRVTMNHIPFSVNASLNINDITTSPAHKRKLTPNSATPSNQGIQNNDAGSKSNRKIDLEDNIVQQLFDDDDVPTFEGEISNDKSAKKPNLDIKIKDEPSSQIIQEIKSEPVDEQDTDENIALLANLNLESLSNNSMNLQFKQEFNTTTDMNTTTSDESDLKFHLAQQTNGSKFLFYWFDAHEDSYNQQGSVFLFGKTPIIRQKDETSTKQTQANQSSNDQLTFASVCCVIKNIPKVIYVLPRKYKMKRVKSETGSDDAKELVTMDKVNQEIARIMAAHRINSYKSKVVRKNYAFDRVLPNCDEAIPYENEYLQIEYLSTDQHSKPLSADIEGEYFSCIFGAQQSYLEHLLIDLKLKGPCWLQIQNAKRRGSADNMGFSGGANVSWCKLEYIVEDYRSMTLYRENCTLENSQILIPTTPPLTTLTLIIKTMLNTKTQEHEIVTACGLCSQKFYMEKATMPSTLKTSGDPSKNLYETYFCALTKPTTGAFPYDLQNTIKSLQDKFRIELCGSERALLAYLLCKIHALDVDIIIGHDLFGFNLDILLNRCVVKKVPHWSRLGRLKRTTMPSMSTQKSNNYSSSTNNLIIQQRIQTVCAGRLLCDVMISAKELLSKCKSFDLPDLVSHILKDKKAIRDYEEEKNVEKYYANSNLMIKFLQLAMMDTDSILRIFNDLQCLQLAYQITCIAGNVLSRTLTGGRSERNEYLLLHAFNDKNFILPDKSTYASKAKAKAANAMNKSMANKTLKSTQIKQETDEDQFLSKMIDGDADETTFDSNKTLAKPSHVPANSYAGGLVLEPRVGYYDRFILLLDFNSLYPSIIQEYNICYTTISRPPLDTDMDDYLNSLKMPSSDEKPGILPMEIKKLVDSRSQVKGLMKDKNISSDLRMQYDIRQKALKITANSVYGCLGFENSRFYCKPLAALITRNGRNLLMKTKELVEAKHIEVIYGDTDSIMINTNLTDYEQVIKLGNMLKSEVNKMYRCLEIDIDGVYKTLLLLKKKKYAALTVVGRNPKDQTFQYQQEIKGLDVVRRDWCILAREVGEKVISEILLGQNCDTVIENINKILTETGEKVKNGKFDLEKFEISKQLQRNPEDYGDANHQAHVIVALRHNKNSNNSKKYKTGNVVSYIICENGTNDSNTQRAYLTSELLRNSNTLKLDTSYYLTNQIHPVITRLCEPIEGIDAFHVAQSLGLDPSGFKHKNTSTNTLSIAPPQLTKQQKKMENYMNDVEKYTKCVPFKYFCPDCKKETHWQSPFVKIEPIQVKTEPTDSTVKVKTEPTDNIKDEEMMDEDLIDISNAGIIVKPSKSNPVPTGNKFKCILDACSNPACKTRPSSKLTYIKNNIQIQLKKFIKQYYQAWLICEDPMCSFRTKRISCKFYQGRTQCSECERYAAELEYSHADLYYQMKFFKFIFDIETFKNYYKDDSVEITNMLRGNKELTNGLNQLRDFVNKSLKSNTYGIVDLDSLFRHF